PIQGNDRSAASDYATTTEYRPRSASPDSAHRQTWARIAIPCAKRVLPPALPAWAGPIWGKCFELEPSYFRTIRLLGSAHVSSANGPRTGRIGPTPAAPRPGRTGWRGCGLARQRSRWRTHGGRGSGGIRK